MSWFSKKYYKALDKKGKQTNKYDIKLTADRTLLGMASSTSRNERLNAINNRCEYRRTYVIDHTIFIRVVRFASRRGRRPQRLLP